jgi:hypothetical protein
MATATVREWIRGPVRAQPVWGERLDPVSDDYSLGIIDDGAKPSRTSAREVGASRFEVVVRTTSFRTVSPCVEQRTTPTTHPFGPVVADDFHPHVGIPMSML